VDLSNPEPSARVSADVSTRYDHRAPVWVVEDSRLYRETIGELIQQSERFRCARSFADGEALLAALNEGKDLPRLVLMDIALPGMSGVECTRAIRKRSPAVPIVMLTVHQSNNQIFEAICAGASGYLLKSQTGDEILSELGTALDGGAAIDGQIARRVLEMFSRMASPRAEYGLSEREREILELLVDGLTKNRIAEHLSLSPHTIDGPRAQHLHEAAREQPQRRRREGDQGKPALVDAHFTFWSTCTWLSRLNPDNTGRRRYSCLLRITLPRAAANPASTDRFDLSSRP
jgi:DNA-binding NarL/FixJ family response regulator